MLDRAFPSCPGHPGKYDLKVVRDDGAFHLHVFASIYPAKKMYDILTGNRKTSWINKTSQRCHDLTISGKYLERIVTHEYTPDEAQWLLPMPYGYYARNIAFNETHAGAPSGEVNAVGSSDTSNNQTGKTGRSSRSERAEKRRNARLTTSTTTSDAPKPVATKRKAQPGVEYGIPELAAASGKEPSKLRAWLRANETKPQEGWLWSTDDYNRILKKIS